MSTITLTVGDRPASSIDEWLRAVYAEPELTRENREVFLAIAVAAVEDGRGGFVARVPTDWLD